MTNDTSHAADRAVFDDSLDTVPNALPLVVVAGPTAIGKTRAGVFLARTFGGEVVNADSRYLYREFSIGVAKPGLGERDGVQHHLIDILPPDGEMSLATFQDLALGAISGVHRAGRLPFLVGGTPLYLNAVVEGWRIPRVPPDPEFRATLESEAERDGGVGLRTRLAGVDPVAAERSGANVRRVIRALEVFEKTGVPMSEQEGKGPRPFRTLEIGLTRPRAELHRLIDERVDRLIASGLVAEVRALLTSGVSRAAPAMSSIGYRQLLPYLDGACSLDDAIHTIKIDTHRYVRQQETWFRRNQRLVPVDVSQQVWLDHCVMLVRQFCEQPVG